MAMHERLDVPQRIDTIELDVPDLAAARHFYLYGLGWMPIEDTPDGIVLEVGPGLRLALVRSDVEAAGVRQQATWLRGAVGSGALTLVLHVETEDAVSHVVDLAGAVGGAVLRPPAPAPGGGVHGYFADPAGFRWEVTTAPPES